MSRELSEFSILLDGREYVCRVQRSRRKSLSLRVLRDGSLSIKCPYFVAGRELEAFLRDRQQWIAARSLALETGGPELSEAELDALKKQARADMCRRVEHYAASLGVKYGRISIRAQKTRWGSCSSKGNLNFNCLLMLCPEEIRNYVAAHELCHLVYMNHSREFWQLVESLCPECDKCRKWLKQNGGAIIGRIR